MKNTKFFVQKLLVGVATLAIAGLATMANAESVKQEIRVWKIEGNARYSTDNKSWHTLHKGDLLGTGAVLQTAEDSSVDILLADAQPPTAQQVVVAPPQAATGQIGGAGFAAVNEGPKPNYIHIYDNSVFSVDTLTKENTGVDEVSETQLNLRSGRIFGNVKKLSAASRFEIKLPNGVAGIRGTSFTVAANGVVYCLTGSVVVSYMVGAQVVSVTVPAGYSLNPFSGPGGTPSLSPTPTVIPAPVLAALKAANPGPQTQQANYTINGTTVHVSPQ